MFLVMLDLTEYEGEVREINFEIINSPSREKLRYNRTRMLQILESYLQISRDEVTGEVVEGSDEPFLEDEYGLSFYRDQVITIGDKDVEILGDNQVQLDIKELVEIFNQLLQITPESEENREESLEPEEEIVE